MTEQSTTASSRAERARRSAERRGPSIDEPAPRRRRLALPNPLAGDAFGRGAEAFARFMGTPAFLVGMTIFCALWLLWNTLMPVDAQFDPKALNFTLLTLILSLQASYAAPLLLLADNRQADRDRVQAEQDRVSNDRSHATTDFITREIATLRLAMNDMATRDFVRGELRDQLEEMAERSEEQRGEGTSGSVEPGRGTSGSSVAATGESALAGVDPEALRAILREEIRRALREERAGA